MSPRQGYLLLGIAGLACGAVAAMDIVAPLRAIPGLLLALLLPGLGLAGALLPHRALGRAERLLVALGTSLVSIILAGLILNVTPGGLRPEPLVVTLAAVTIISSVFAYRRAGNERKLAPVEPAVVEPIRGAHPFGLFGLGAALTAAAFMLAVWGATNQPVAYFTELWAIPRAGSERLEVGVRNLEAEPKSYRLEIESDGRLLEDWPLIELSPGETWSETLTLAGLDPEQSPVTARLYLTSDVDSGTPYREVILRGDSSGGS